MLKDGSYCHTLHKLNVLETVRRNRRKFQPDSEVHDSLYMQIQKNTNDSKRVMFTETSSPSHDSHEPCIPLDSQIQGPKLELY